MGNDPVNGIDPTGLERHEIVAEVEILGQKIQVSGEFDDETLEVGASLTAGVGLGLEVDVGGEYTSEASSSKGNNAALTFEGKATAQANASGGATEHVNTASAEASTGQLSLSTNKGVTTTAPSTSTEVIVGGERTAGSESGPVSERVGIGAGVAAKATATVSGNITVAPLVDAAEGVKREATRQFNRAKRAFFSIF